VVPRLLLGLAFAGIAWAAPASAQQADPAAGGGLGLSADEFAAILAPTTRIRTRSLVAGEGVEPGEPGSGVVPDLKIQFGSNSADLSPDARATLDALAEAMNREELRELRFEVAGHTDAKGSDKYNQELSRRRAASVVGYLAEDRGVGGGRLRAVGYGESRLVDPANPNSGANRRVEVRTIW
jgi:outer membrane protein OmpA-like peptidoglycan-associated protein